MDRWCGDERRISNKKAMWDQAVAVIEDLGGSVSVWKPIRTAPKDNSDILVWSKDAELVQQVYWNFYHKMWSVSTLENCPPYAPPTHWMPLPEPPKDGDEILEVSNGNS